MKIRSLISRFFTLLLAGGVAVVALSIGVPRHSNHNRS